MCCLTLRLYQTINQFDHLNGFMEGWKNTTITRQVKHRLWDNNWMHCAIIVLNLPQNVSHSTKKWKSMVLSSNLKHCLFVLDLSLNKLSIISFTRLFLITEFILLNYITFLSNTIKSFINTYRNGAYTLKCHSYKWVLLIIMLSNV